MKSCLPPDPDLRWTAFSLPPLSCDAHCHVFGPAAQFPYAPDTTYVPPDAPRQALARLHESLGIERAVIVQASCHGTDNRATLDAIAHSGGRYRGVAIVGDDFDDRQAATLHEGGIRGVRFNFVRHLGGVPDLGSFARTLERIRPPKVFFKAVGIVMYGAPIGAFGAIAFTVGRFGAASLLPLAMLIVEFFVVSALFTAIVLGGVAWWAGANIVRLMAYIRDELVLVAATTSSESVLPRLIEKLGRLGCDEGVVGLVIPTGYSFNLDGTCLYLTTTALFLAQATDTPLSLLQQLGLIAVLLLTSKGAAGVAGAAFVVLAATLDSTGSVPVASIGLILGIHRILAEALTFVNVVGNCVATIVVARWEGALDSDTLRRELAAGPAR